MEPPEQPHAGEAGEVLEGLLVARLGKEFEDVAFGLVFGGLVQGLKLHLLVRGEKADGAKGKQRLQAFHWLRGGRRWLEHGLGGVEA